VPLTPSTPKPTLPIAVYHEHQDWFRPLFSELDRRGTPYVRIDARRHHFDIAARDHEFSLLFNRMSPSAYLRGETHGIYHTLAYLDHLERLGTRVVNGSRGFRVEISKALQLSLLASLRLRYPHARVINHPAEAPEAARGLRFPVVVKANVGGSGAGIVRYDDPETLAAAAERCEIDLGIDSTALVQEFVPARDGHIVRVETLGRKYLYAIKVWSAGNSFNLCPADACQTTSGAALNSPACALDAQARGIRVEGYTPPDEVIADVERIFEAAAIDVGGVEYMIDDRSGEILYYDINALSNFVADAPRVVGFDPFSRLVDYLEAEAVR
jgi:ribosomal protein S6-L-glutamate ligase RimK-like protein